MFNQTPPVTTHEQQTISHHPHLEILQQSDDVDLYGAPSSMKICVIDIRGLKNYDLNMIYCDGHSAIYETQKGRFYVLKDQRLCQAKKKCDHVTLMVQI
jgi:hypothetical protein